MSTENQNWRWTYQPNGVSTSFPYDNLVMHPGDLIVRGWTESGGPFALPAYTVTGIGNAQGGNVIFDSPPAAAPGAIIEIERRTGKLQGTTFKDFVQETAAARESRADRAMLGLQELEGRLNRVIAMSPLDAAGPYVLPPASLRANKALLFGANGAPIVGAPMSPGAMIVSGFMEALLESVNADEANGKLAGRGLVDPRWFGAKCDGVTDDTPAWNAALAHLQLLGGGTLRVPPLKQKVNGPLVYTGSNLAIVGDGTSSHIFKHSTTGNFFQFAGDKYRFQGFIIECPGVHTGGTLFNLATVGGNVWIADVWTHQGWDVLKLGTGAQLYIADCTFNNFEHDGIRPGPNWGGLTHIHDCEMNAPPATNTGSGLYFESGDTFVLSGLNITAQNIPIRFQPPAGKTLVNIFGTNVLADGIGRTAGEHGWLMQGTAAGCTFGRVFLNNCWAGINVGDGYRVVGGDIFHFTNCIAITNQKNGFYFTAAPSHVRMHNCIAAGNAFSNGNVYSGVKIEDFMSDFEIMGGKFGPTGLVTNNEQKYNIEIVGTNHDRYRVVGVTVVGGVTGTMLDQGAGPTKQIASNFGYVTQKIGSGTVASGATAVTVPHGLSVTPTAADLHVTPVSSATNDPGNWWVSNITSSSFVVNIRNDPGASGWGFAWGARCLQ